MSYLPRMSKTYKEPKETTLEEPDVNPSNYTIQPASSLLNERTNNPQVTLKHYRYIPHPLPVLPGPSVAEEAHQNELYLEASRLRRMSARNNDSVDSSQTILPTQEPSEVSVEQTQSKDDIVHHLKRPQSKRVIKGSSKSSVGKKKSSKVSIDKKKESGSKVKDVTVHMCLMGTDIVKNFEAVQPEGRDGSECDATEFFSQRTLNSLKREKSIMPLRTSNLSTKTLTSMPSLTKDFLSEEKRSEIKVKDTTHRSVQCTIFGSADKVYVMPLVINSLLRALAFLLHEVNREEATNCNFGERKRIMNQIQLILGDLCNQKCHKEFGFDTTYSDSKRIEKIYGDLQRYIKGVYGDKGEFTDRLEDMKRVFVDLKKKEMELAVLNDKLSEKDTLQITEVEVKESEYKNPEITLQNKRLESEQLLAQIEFSSMELRKCQKTLAEVEWDIKNYHEQMASLKKSLTTKSKTEVLGRRASLQKFSNEVLPMVSKSKESEVSERRRENVTFLL